MDFLSLHNYQPNPQAKVFYYSRAGGIIAVVIFTAITVACLYVGYRGGIELGGDHLPGAIGYGVGFFMGLFGLIAYGNMKARFLPTNWIMRVSPEAVVLKFRSYINHHYPSDDIQIAAIPTNEIAWARRVKMTHIKTDSRNRKVITMYPCVDLRVDDEKSMEALAGHIRAEMARKPYGKGAVRGKSNHYPVQVVNGVIRVEFSGVCPSASAALEALGQLVAVEPIHREKIDDSYRPDLSDEKLTAQVQHLLGRGDRIAAVSLLRSLKEMSLADAKKYIDSL